MRRKGFFGIIVLITLVFAFTVVVPLEVDAKKKKGKGPNPSPTGKAKGIRHRVDTLEVDVSTLAEDLQQEIDDRIAGDENLQDQIDDLNDSRFIYAGGWVTADGSIGDSFGNPWTVTKGAPGNYTITLEGYNIGCDHLITANFIATPAASGFINTVGGLATLCATGDSDKAIETWSITGIPQDMPFSFVVYVGQQPYGE